MSCASCGRANRAGARFCAGCGASLAPRCPACGVEARPDARFCDACGAALAPASAPAEASVARKVVTIVFADLIGSTALQEKLDPESVSRVMEAYHAAVRVPVEAHGGTVVQLLGDGVMCAFGVPQVAEDDAFRAVRAAVAVQQAFRAFVTEHPELAGKVGLRVAVNTGEVVVSDDYAAGIGDPLNVAARLQQEARDGDVLIGESTQRHVRERVTLVQVGSFALKGRAEPVAAYRVVSLERPPGAAALPFVGREDELRRLQAVYDAALSAPAARLAVLLGSPGLGKSRLVAELAQRLEGRVALLSARCESARGATFAPLAAALRAHLGERGEPSAQVEALLPADEPERARIVSGVAALLAGEPASPQETFFVVRRFLAALAKPRPVLLVVDDLHWAEPLLLDLVEHLVQWGVGVRLLVLAAARPELRALRSSLATPGPLASDVVTLAGLDAVAATQLAARVIGAEAFPAAIAGRVLAASEGNPLFLAELVRMLVDDGVLRRQGEAWVAADAIADFAMPPSIHALLAARIERLAPEERTVLERAAVVGRHFSRSALAALLPRELSDLYARLEALRRSELIEPDTGWLLGEPALRFHHALIRDAAYRRLLKNTRAELHARIAGWIEERVGAAVEYDETIGWHFEQAHQNLRELGPLDERARDFGARAARYLGAAGQRALARDDLPLAAGLLGRALERLEPESPARTELLLDCCEALLATGEVGAATPAVAELERLAAGSERLRAWHTCFAGQLAALTDPEALRATAEAAAAAADTLAAAGDTVGEAKAHSVHAGALARLGAIGSCEAALDRALAAARRAGDRRRSNAVLAGAPLAALLGPSPVTRASGRCLDVVRVLRITQGAPAVEAVALRCQAVLEALRGRLDAARRMIAAARRLVEELGITQQLLESSVFAGQIEWLAGDAVAAERWLRDAYTGLRQRGLRIDAARAAAQLGRILLAQGRAREAEELSHESEALAGDDLQAAIAWRGVRAEALAQRGEHSAAIDLARSAVEIAAATDALLHHADARRALAAVLAAAGRSEAAAGEDARALELWEAKGATLLAERARREVSPGVPLRSTRAADEREIARRQVRENAATASAARMEAAVEARDLDAIAVELAELAEVVEHPTGAGFDGRAMFVAWRHFLQAEAPVFRSTPLATLGDSLAICCSSMSFAALGPRGESELGSFGAVEREELALIEVGARGLQRRIELFAPDQLGDAVARLYARHAELLPTGPERTRAETTARAVAAWLERESRADRFDGHVRASLRFIDHQRGGFGSVSGAEAFLSGHRALHELARDVSFGVEEVPGLEPDAFLLRTRTSGIDRASGGVFERPLLLLGSFEGDGRIARVEWFDPERPDEGLARFDALAAPQRPAVRRRVRPNAATANLTRIEASVAAREVDEFAALHEPGFESLHHPTEATFDREATVAALRWMVRSGASFRLEPLATLGDALALFHQRVSSPASGNPRFEVGAYELEFFGIHEAEEAGRARRTEAFAVERLGDAIARLYARYAERLPEDPERERATATAQAVAAILGPFDVARYRTAIQPNVEFVDHRSVPFPSGRGADELLRGVGSFLETADDATTRVDDVLALRSDALLLRWTTAGRERIGGGLSQWQFLRLLVLGPDGLLTRAEQFDVGHEAEALARFDALAVEPLAARRRVRPNAATENALRLDAAIAARDAEAIAELVADPTSTTHHPTGVEYGRDEVLRGLLRWIALPAASYRHEPLATLGDSLALCRTSALASGASIDDLDLGPVERENVALIEADVHGRRRRVEIFAVERFGDAVARLYERHAELLPEGPERERAAATARAAAAWLGPLDPERNAAAYAADLEAVDHRVLGTWSARGAAAVLRNFRSLSEVARDIVMTDELLALGPQATLVRRTHRGTELASGGAYEREFLMLHVYGPEGLVARIEWFDADAEALAFARFDAFAAEPPADRFENAATRSEAEFGRLWRAGEWAAWAALTPPGFRSIDRRPLMHLVVDGETMLRGIQPIFEMGAERRSQLLATRGEWLALFRMRLRTSDAAEGTSEVEYLQVVEVDERGQRIAAVAFGADDLDAAHAELDARYAAGEGAAYPALLSGLQETRRALAAPDREALARILPSDFTVTSHRRFANVGQTLSRDAYVASLGLNDALGVQADLRLDHLRVSRTALIGDATWHGTRDGGEFEVPLVFVATHDGERQRSCELFDREQTDAALSRYVELSARSGPPRLGNRAFRALEHLGLCWRARNWEAVVAAYAAGFVLDDRRALVGLPVAGEDFLGNVRFMYAIPSSRFEFELLATRGARLVLCRTRFSGEVEGGGAFEWPMLTVVEVDEGGRLTWHVVFDRDAVDAAHAELDARYAAGEGVGDPAWRNVVAWTESFNTRDFEGLARLLGSDFALQDHRALGWGTVDGARFVALLRSLSELAADARYRLDHFVSGGRGCLTVGTMLGTRDGGPFEMTRISVVDFDAAGRRRRTDQYDPERLDAALSRYAELAEAAATARFANAATRALERVTGHWDARDWESLVAMYGPGFELDDRRALVGLPVSGDDFLTSLRLMFELRSSRFHGEPLATRGERLVLLRTRFTGEAGAGGAIDVPMLSLVEVAADGRYARLVVFDPDALEAAFAELDARYTSGEGAEDVSWHELQAWMGAFARRDFAALAEGLAPDFALHDHRALGWGAVNGERYVELLRSLTELAPDSRYRLDHFVSGGRGCLTVGRVLGTRDGGAFEMARITVVELDAAGRRRRMDQYDDAGQLDLARARFEVLASAPSAAHFENAATRWLAPAREAEESRDAERLEALHAPDFELSDRRPLLRLELNLDQWMRGAHWAFEQSVRNTSLTVATRGDRLALLRVQSQVSDDLVGPSEREWLSIVEVNAAARRVGGALFDPAALDAAYAELDARYFAGEAAAHPRAAATMRAFIAAFASRDWDALGALFAADVEARDQRRLGWAPLRGRAAYVTSLRSLVELAPDAQLRIDHARLSARGAFWVASWVGTREGGAFETPWIIVSEHDAAGVVQRFDQYDVERLDAALARFEELTPDPLAIPPNAATRTAARLDECFATGDMEALAAGIAPSCAYDDRRRGIRNSGDRETFLASGRLIQATGTRPTRTPLATAGERLALAHTLWRNERLGTEVETLDVTEVDAEGRIVAFITFDPDDRRSASEEMFVRFHRGEGARAGSERFIEFVRASNAHDAVRARTTLPDGFVFHDHRRTGLGRLGNADDYLASLAGLWEQSSDAAIDTLYYIALAEHAALAVGRIFGTLASGGEFESLFVRLGLFRDGHFVGAEVYELEDLERARARFEELRPDPLRIPPNAATRTAARLDECFATGDMEALAAGIAPSCAYDDRRRGIRNSGGREAFLASARLIQSAGSRPIREVLATAGERLVLEHALWRNERLGTEVETFDVIEVDAEGRLVAFITFDLDDRRAASEETSIRFHRGEGARAGSERLIEFVRASNAHDAARARAALPDDFVFHDHRRTGLGRLGNADDYVASLAGLWEQSNDAAIDTLYYIALAEHAALAVGRIFGTLADGGEFESLFLRLGLYRNGQIVGAELYELEDLDRARARFEELRPDPLRIPPNLAMRSSARLHECFATGDMDAFAAGIAPGFVFDDRRRGIRNSGDRETFLASARMIQSAGSRPTRTLLATAGERLALEHALWLNDRFGTEIETLDVIEVDAEGRLVASVVFDPDDRRAASLEMLERSAAEGAARLPAVAFAGLRALNDHDLDQLRALMPTHFFVDDHRRTGLGRIEGAERFLTSLVPLFEQAPDLTFETLHTVAAENHGELAMVRSFGTLAASGGAVESFYARILWVQGDQIVGMELFEPDDLEVARARFEELRPDPLAIPPNAARRAGERIGEIRTRGDWPALRALVAPDFRFDDRRKHTLLSGDVELYVRNLEVVRSYPALNVRFVPLATAGERLSLARLSYAGDPEGGAFEGEFLLLLEVDAEARLRASLHFDADDRAKAFAEMQQRFVAGEAAGVGGQAPIATLIQAFNGRDWAALRAVLAEEAAVLDRRTLGLGELGAGAWIDSLRALAELAGDVRMEPFRILAWNGRGRVSVTRMHGTRDGGAFENLLVTLALTRGDRIERFELFDPADAERALARFAELSEASH